MHLKSIAVVWTASADHPYEVHRMTQTKPLTRIQQKNRSTILEAALDVFSRYGFRGSTLDQIAQESGLSKPNLLYYFPSKEAIHAELLKGLLENWLDPLHALSHDGDPADEIMAYVERKLEILGREKANEVLLESFRLYRAEESRLRGW